MKKIGNEPLTQAEITKRYREKHNLVLFSTRVDKDLYDELLVKLKEQGLNKRAFTTDAIKKFLKR